jgi:hypothetical protein
MLSHVGIVTCTVILFMQKSKSIFVTFITVVGLSVPPLYLVICSVISSVVTKHDTVFVVDYMSGYS